MTGPWLRAVTLAHGRLLKRITGIEWHRLAYGLPHFCPTMQIEILASKALIRLNPVNLPPLLISMQVAPTAIPVQVALRQATI